MLGAEQELPADERMQLVSIVTPNDSHLPIAKAALAAGFRMFGQTGDADREEALELKASVEASDKLYALTHACLGYPLVKEARHLSPRARSARSGRSTSNILRAGCRHCWNSRARNRPTGVLTRRDRTVGCMRHRHACGNTGRIRDRRPDRIGLRRSVDLRRGPPARRRRGVLFHPAGGAKGVLTASRVCNGENNLNIHYGETGGLEWCSRNRTRCGSCDRASRSEAAFRSGPAYLSPAAQAHIRTPGGHPEGYFEAFANIYRNFAFAVAAHEAGENHDPLHDYPTIDNGLSGLAFVDAILRNSRGNEKWTDVPFD